MSPTADLLLKLRRYFTKIECFCFKQQTLAAGQTVDMPVMRSVGRRPVSASNIDTQNEY